MNEALPKLCFWVDASSDLLYLCSGSYGDLETYPSIPFISQTMVIFEVNYQPAKKIFVMHLGCCDAWSRRVSLFSKQSNLKAAEHLECFGELSDTCPALIYQVFIQTKPETHKVSFSHLGSVTANIHTDVRYLYNTFPGGVKRSSTKGKQTNTCK